MSEIWGISSPTPGPQKPPFLDDFATQRQFQRPISSQRNMIDNRTNALTTIEFSVNLGLELKPFKPRYNLPFSLFHLTLEWILRMC